MIPAHILCNPNYWPSIQKDSEILAKRVAAMDRVRVAQEQLAKTFERAAA